MSVQNKHKSALPDADVGKHYRIRTEWGQKSALYLGRDGEHRKFRMVDGAGRKVMDITVVDEIRLYEIEQCWVRKR